jgi:hypothetical protein
MFLRLQRYDIELSYKQGKHMYIADTLSRAYLKTNKDEVKTQDEILLVRSDIEVEVEQINMAVLVHFLSNLQFQYVYVFDS